ncbi:TRAP transporter substrate-binding protein [Bacillus sp. P14.5]|uniref:TRAP transporter substrate-binding protein n=1 Tax=Bacillus sp. P14.5 TaxID=1983400 RepID=UPI000DE99A6C|nr:TRAP transporter substrate-binding protein [Bacillus sp. P14.5]
MKNYYGIRIVLLLVITSLWGCSARAVEGGQGDGPVIMRLAHNQGENHPIHTSLSEFARLVEEKTEGSIDMKLYPGGQLGSEREAIELTQTGAIDFAKVSASTLENFSEEYSVLSLPYLFDDKDHFYKVMNSGIAEELYDATRDIGFKGLTFYDSGTRNFYTKDTPILHPDDLQGMKVRVQPTPTTIEMIELMGGAPTPMPFGEVYTSLQQGVIDGTENNETALTDANHGEVAKEYSFSGHAIVPDILIINEKKWNQLTEEQRELIQEAADESTVFHKEVWKEAVESAIEKSKENGVTFHEVDLEPFIQAVQPLHEEFATKESTTDYYKEIRELSVDGNKEGE